MTTNDAAERLNMVITQQTKPGRLQEAMLRTLAEALAAEYWRGVAAARDGVKDPAYEAEIRLATVERLAPWLVHPITCRGFVEPDAPCTCGLDAILDAGAER
jgi:hypothetical protein